MNKKECKKIDYQKEALASLMSKIHSGSISVPNFQRDYVWETERMVNFLNSLLNEEPFGFIINWSAPNLKIETRNEIIKSLSSESGGIKSYIIDGQQRLTSLFSIFQSREIIKMEVPEDSKLNEIKKSINSIHFNLTTKMFCKKRIKKSNDIQIPIYNFIDKWDSVLNTEEIIKFNDYPNLSDKEKMKIISTMTEINTKLRKTEVGIIHLNGYSIDEVIDIFDKINTQGKKLSIFEIINSKWYSRGISLENEFHVLKDYSTKNYINDLDNIIPLDSFFLIVDDNKPIISGKEKFEYETNFNIEEMREKILKFKDSFKKAIDFLKDKGFSSRTLPSKLIIKWLTYLFYKNDNNKLNSNQSSIVFKYICLISLNSFYSSSTNNRIKDNIEFVDNLLDKKFDKIKSIFDSFDLNDISDNDIKAIKYKSTTMLSFLVKHLLYKRSYDLRNGTTISIANLKDIDMHHLFAKKTKTETGETYDSIYKEKINSIANLMPIDSKTNQEFIKNEEPSKYYDLLKKENNDLDKHLEFCFINVDFFKGNNFIDFLNDRSKNIADYLNNNYFEYESLFKEQDNKTNNN